MLLDNTLLYPFNESLPSFGRRYYEILLTFHWEQVLNKQRVNSHHSRDNKALQLVLFFSGMVDFRAGNKLNWSFITVVQLCLSLALFIYYRNHSPIRFLCSGVWVNPFSPKWIEKPLCSAVGLCWGFFFEG